MTRRNRPSSTTSVTAPLSASSSSAARLGHFLDQAVELGAGEQGAGQVAEPLQLPVPPVCLVQRPPKRVLLGLRQLPNVAERDQRHQGCHRGEQQAEGVVLAEQPEAEPGDDDRDAGDGAGIGQPPPVALDRAANRRTDGTDPAVKCPPPSGFRGTRFRRCAASGSGRGGRGRTGRRIRSRERDRARSQPDAVGRGEQLLNGVALQMQRDTSDRGRNDVVIVYDLASAVPTYAPLPTGWWAGYPARSPGPGRAGSARAGWSRRRPRAAGCGWAPT